MQSADFRLTRLAHLRRTARPTDAAAMRAVVEARSRDCRERRVTGMMLQARDVAFEVLEGPGCAVEALFREASGDDLAAPLVRQHAFFRRFRDWSMGCVDLPSETAGADGVFRVEWAEVRRRMPFERGCELCRYVRWFCQTKCAPADICARMH